MSDQLNEPTTQSLAENITARFDRLESLIVSLASQSVTLQSTVNDIARDQRDMYVDLRHRSDLVKDEVELLRREIRQLIQDRQPNSIASRLMS
ncbi:MAG: hypothetical protein ACRD82_09325 [Blastocatellia bacterium]